MKNLVRESDLIASRKTEAARPGLELSQLVPDLFGFRSDGDHELFSVIAEHSEIGIVLVDSNFQIISQNSSACTLLDRNNGLLRVGRTFSASAVNEKKVLMEAFNQALMVNENPDDGPLDAQFLLISRKDSLPITVALIPVSRMLKLKEVNLPNGASAPAVVALICDPENSLAQSVRIVCQLYGLTQAETRLAELLTNGLSLAEIAQSMSLKLTTVRVYLKQIFMKTGVHRQPMLIRLLLTSRIPISLSNSQRMVTRKSRSATIAPLRAS